MTTTPEPKTRRQALRDLVEDIWDTGWDDGAKSEIVDWEAGSGIVHITREELVERYIDRIEAVTGLKERTND